MPFFYRTGEEIRSGDRIIYGGEPGEVEFFVDAAAGDPTTDWYLEEFPGGGFMIHTPKLGSIFLSGSDPEEKEDLELA